MFNDQRKPIADRPPKGRSKTMLLKITGGLIALSLVVFVLSELAPGMRDIVVALQSKIHSAKPFLHLIQFFLIALLWWRWSRVIAWLVKRGSVAAENEQVAQSARNRIVLMLLFIQIFVVVGIPFRNPFA